jgi:hypothetical protein
MTQQFDGRFFRRGKKERKKELTFGSRLKPPNRLTVLRQALRNLDSKLLFSEVSREICYINSGQNDPTPLGLHFRIFCQILISSMDRAQLIGPKPRIVFFPFLHNYAYSVPKQGTTRQPGANPTTFKFTATTPAL